MKANEFINIGVFDLDPDDGFLKRVYFDRLSQKVGDGFIHEGEKVFVLRLLDFVVEAEHGPEGLLEQN